MPELRSTLMISPGAKQLVAAIEGYEWSPSPQPTKKIEDWRELAPAYVSMLRSRGEDTAADRFLDAQLEAIAAEEDNE